jgi:hypothetical protein
MRRSSKKQLVEVKKDDNRFETIILWVSKIFRRAWDSHIKNRGIIAEVKVSKNFFILIVLKFHKPKNLT